MKCVLLCSQAQALKEEPDNEYIGISAAPAWRLLRQWASLPPAHAAAVLRAACEQPRGVLGAVAQAPRVLARPFVRTTAPCSLQRALLNTTGQCKRLYRNGKRTVKSGAGQDKTELTSVSCLWFYQVTRTTVVHGAHATKL